MFDLQGQVAIVTGGANGIGRGIANCLHQAGAKVVIADLDEKKGKLAAQALEGDFIETDITAEEEVKALFHKVAERYGKIDILCANAGIFPQVRLDQMTLADWEHVLTVNLTSTFLSVKYVSPYMKEKAYGRIVVTSSITGPVTGYPGWAHYAASKAGQLGFIHSAALELAKYGITINAVQPGNIKSEGLMAQGEAYMDGMRSTIPTHKLGEPEDIGAAACFFASPEAQFITGQNLVIDGGQTLPEDPGAILYRAILEGSRRLNVSGIS